VATLIINDNMNVDTLAVSQPTWPGVTLAGADGPVNPPREFTQSSG